MEQKVERSPDSTHISQTSPLHPPLETKLPRSAWVSFNSLRTSVGRFCSNMYKWGLAPSTACECGKKQTADHIINNCLFYNPPNGERSRKILEGKRCPGCSPSALTYGPVLRKQQLTQTKKKTKNSMQASKTQTIFNYQT